MWKRLGALLTVVVTAVLLLIGGAGTASAHATLVSTDPANNAVVATAPAAVTLTFSEGVSLSPDSVRVLGPDGTSVDSGEPGHVDGKAATARVALRPGLANGTYTVAWRAVSEDSHPIGGAFTFSIGAPSATTVSAAALQDVKADGAVAFAYGTGRTVAYAAFALLAGAAAFVLICWPAGAAVRSVQRLLMTGWVSLLVSTVAVLLLRGPYERGTGIGQAFDLSLVRSTLDERIGTALSVRLLLLAAAGSSSRCWSGSWGRPGRRPLRRPRRRLLRRPLRRVMRSPTSCGSWSSGPPNGRSGTPGWASAWPVWCWPWRSPPPGPGRTTPRSASRSGWRCRPRWCTCWRWRSGWAG
ncbi:copper resistance protein CopC [Kitasatospora gansuensis]